MVQHSVLDECLAHWSRSKITQPARCEPKHGGRRRGAHVRVKFRRTGTGHMCRWWPSKAIQTQTHSRPESTLQVDAAAAAMVKSYEPIVG